MEASTDIEVYSEYTYKLVRCEPLESIEVYNKYINWLLGEFDLYLKEESGYLKVFFPNGRFSIKDLKNGGKILLVEVKVEGRSKVACDILMERLLRIYNSVLLLDSHKKI